MGRGEGEREGGERGGRGERKGKRIEGEREGREVSVCEYECVGWCGCQCEFSHNKDIPNVSF